MTTTSQSANYSEYTKAELITLRASYESEAKSFRACLLFEKGRMHKATSQDIAERELWIAEINSELATRN